MKQFILIFFATTLLCQGQIINFPDPNFKNALLFRYPFLDRNGDGEIQISEAEAFYSSMVLKNKNISDLTGIEYFINIGSLYADGNNLTEVDLSNNTNLQIVKLNDNNITSIDLGINTVLYNLEINYNELTSIDISNNPALVFLYATYNQLTYINLGNGNRLNTLNVAYNQLTSLDVSQVQNLEILVCNYNLLTDINFGAASGIGRIFCSNNQLSEININSDGTFWLLECNSNKLTDLTITSPPSAFVRIECKNNLFTELDLTTFRLKRLDCSENPLLENLNLRNGWNFEFDIGNSKFQNLPILNSVFIYSYNQELMAFVLAEVGHPLDFYNNETCDALSVNENIFTNLIITPNPVEYNLKIEAEKVFKEIILYNERGQNVMSFHFSSALNHTVLDIPV